MLGKQEEQNGLPALGRFLFFCCNLTILPFVNLTIYGLRIRVNSSPSFVKDMGRGKAQCFAIGLCFVYMAP